MNNKTKKIDTALYNIFKEIYEDDEVLQQAINEAKIAYSSIKQDALFRSIPAFIYYEQQ